MYRFRLLFIVGMVVVINIQAAVQNVQCTVVSYSDKPVYVSVVNIDAASVYNALGVASGSAVTAVNDFDASILPVELVTLNGVDTLSVHVSLLPLQTLSFSISPSQQWPVIHSANWDAASGGGEISNGIISVTYDSYGLDMSYAGLAATPGDRAILNNIYFKGWLDDADNGAVIDPQLLGLCLVNTRNAPLSASTNIDDRGATLTLTRGFDGLGSGVELTETITALKNLPAFEYKLEFKNNSISNRWLAWADGTISGSFPRNQSWLKDPYWGDSLYDLSIEDFSDHVKYWYNPPSWSYMASWDENDRGVALTTLKLLSGSHYHNKTMWKADLNSFSLDQVETVSGYLPIRIAPGATVELGGCFLATDSGTNAFRQAGKFFYSLGKSSHADYETPFSVRVDDEFVKAAKTEYFIEEFEDVDRWFVDGVGANISGSGVVLSLEENSASVSCALEMDFTNEMFLNFSLSDVDASINFQAKVRPLNSATAVTLLNCSNVAGTYRVSIPEQTGWSDYKAFELIFEITGDIDKLVTVGFVSILPPPCESPELVTPYHAWDITDIAVCLSWKSVEDIVDYRLEVSRDVEFVSPLVFQLTTDSEMCTYYPRELLDTGIWFWRVCVVDGLQLGEFSQPRAFIVNNNHSTSQLLRPVSPESPLFTFEAFKVEDLSKFSNSIPQDIRPYTAIVSDNQYFVYKQTNLEHYSKVAGQSNSFMIRTHGPGSMGWSFSLTDVERLFKSYPNIIGICVGENFWNYWQWDTDGSKDYITRLVKLCAKYGRLYIWGDGNGTTFKWQQYASDEYWSDFARQYSNYVIFSQKNNINHTMHTTQGALMGMWLSGMVSNLGSWSECWYWNDAGFAELGEYLGPKMGYIDMFPRNYYNLSFLHGIAQGATVFNIDGQGTMGSTKPGIWNHDGQTTETFNDYLVPFIRGIVEHGLVPHKNEVLSKVKIAIEQPERFQNIAHEGDYGVYQALYDQTYGFRAEGKWYEYIPNNGKYYYFPLLPYGVSSLGEGVHIETLADMADPDYASNVFDAKYTEPYYGTALHSVVGDSIFIQNTNENVDVDENYIIESDNGNIKRISGIVGPHKYIMGTFEHRGTILWLQVNTEYLERDTEIILDCAWKPGLKIEPANALIHANWDVQTSKYTIAVSHGDGAVAITVDSADIFNDGFIDYYDMLELVQYWLFSGENIVGDFNDDNIVSLNDFSILSDRIRTSDI